MPNLVQQNGSNAVAVAGANPWAEAARGVESGSYLAEKGMDIEDYQREGNGYERLTVKLKD
jgi:hypothetical protein